MADYQGTIVLTPAAATEGATTQTVASAVAADNVRDDAAYTPKQTVAAVVTS